MHQWSACRHQVRGWADAAAAGARAKSGLSSSTPPPRAGQQGISTLHCLLSVATALSAAQAPPLPVVATWVPDDMCTRPGPCQELPGKCNAAQGYCVYNAKAEGVPCPSGTCDGAGSCIDRKQQLLQVMAATGLAARHATAACAAEAWARCLSVCLSVYPTLQPSPLHSRMSTPLPALPTRPTC